MNRLRLGACSKLSPHLSSHLSEKQNFIVKEGENDCCGQIWRVDLCPQLRLIKKFLSPHDYENHLANFFWLHQNHWSPVSWNAAREYIFLTGSQLLWWLQSLRASGWWIEPSRASNAEKDTGCFDGGMQVAFTLLGRGKSQALSTSTQRSSVPLAQDLCSRIIHPFLEHPTLGKVDARWV